MSPGNVPDELRKRVRNKPEIGVATADVPNGTSLVAWRLTTLFQRHAAAPTMKTTSGLPAGCATGTKVPKPQPLTLKPAGRPDFSIRGGTAGRGISPGAPPGLMWLAVQQLGA